MKYKYIIWDWNGTLYDDVQIGIDAMNEMLKIKGFNSFLTVDSYREIFCFPIIEYYRRVGFDFSVYPFEELAELYISLYEPRQDKAVLYPKAEYILDKANKSGAEQTVISACEKSRLADQINQFGIMDYFSAAIGTDDNFAVSKAELAKSWLNDNKINPNDAVFIGDTVHDFEVAQAVGCKCILVAGGHQSLERLKSTGTEVVNRLEEVIDYI
ncbi:MAG: HAD family hydrolase [Eubacterium sp.]